MTRIAIIGGGDLGRLIAHHAPICGNFTIAGFFDDYASPGALISGFPVLGNLESIPAQFDSQNFDALMVGIGYNHMAFRKSIFEKFFSKIPFARLVHPSAYVDPSANLGEGVFILPGCTVDTQVVLGNNVLLNTGVVVAHDSIVREHSFCGPAVAIAGKTSIGACCIVGINATIIDHLEICSGTRIAAGAVVNQSIDQPGMYAGVPAQLKKRWEII